MLRHAQPMLTRTGRALAAPKSSRLLTSSASTTIAAFRQTSSLRPRPFIPGETLPVITRIAYSTKQPLQPTKIDRELEKEIGQRKLEHRPDEVTSQSSVRHVIESNQAVADEGPDVMHDLKQDVNSVKEAFALGDVPRQPYILGLAGTLPYLATSLSTVFLSWNINAEWPSTSTFLNHFMISNEAASQWLTLLEPIQVGYGAVIISFLGAIHWGLEFAEKKALPERTRFRYLMGVTAPLIAWPSIFMPIPWALTTQFGAFLSIYFLDSRAAVRGWTPAWYGTYRFVLTAVVGVALLISLVGRAKVGEGHTRLTSADLQERLSGKSPAEKYRNWAKEEAEEKERLREEKKKAEKKAKEEEKEKKKAKGQDKEKQKEEKDEDKSKDEAKEKSEDKSENKSEGKSDSEGQKKSEGEGEKKSK